MNTGPCGTVTQLRAAQQRYDDWTPMEPDEEVDERLWAIEAAEEMLATARAELCKVGPNMAAVDRLMADAANCLIKE